MLLFILYWYFTIKNVEPQKCTFHLLVQNSCAPIISLLVENDIKNSAAQH